ncbi:MAG: DUF695 domain-containing protein [Chryseobacterium sp.]|nr:MAG: DUF695 domain-containing protein [Chryseobacterium sp.]
MIGDFSYKFMDEDDCSVFVRGRKIDLSSIDIAEYSERVEIVYHFRGDAATRLPDEETLTLVDQMEQAITEHLGKNDFLVLSFTGNNRRMLCLYTSDVSECIDAVNRAVPADVPLEIIHDTDGEWHFYRNFNEAAQ